MFGLLLLALFAGSIEAHTCPGIANIDFNATWGPPEKIDDTSIRPFKIEFDQEMIDDLLYRLNNHRAFTPALSDVDDFEWGVHPKELESWVDYWCNNYNFTEREIFLNQFPQFVTDIRKLTIHFIHVVPEVPEGKKKLPLLLLNGWPSSIREFYDVIPLLIEPSEFSDYVFEVVVPSLPGFGFSDAAVFPGLGAVEIGLILRDLMHRLGHKKFVISGGDWGGIISSNLVTIDPGTILGYHTTMPYAMTPEAYAYITLGSIFPPAIMNTNLIDRLYPLSSTMEVYCRESGYFHVHASKPDTLGVSLKDSPVGLLTWIIQQYSDASNTTFINLPDGGLSIFAREQLIDNIMIYWKSGCITSSMRIYAESFNKRNWHDAIFACPAKVPTCVTQAIGELFYMPEMVLATKYPLLLNVDPLDYGGHFLGYEQPETLAEQIHKAMQINMDYREKNNM